MLDLYNDDDDGCGPSFVAFNETGRRSVDVADGPLMVDEVEGGERCLIGNLFFVQLKSSSSV